MQRSGRYTVLEQRPPRTLMATAVDETRRMQQRKVRTIAGGAYCVMAIGHPQRRWCACVRRQRPGTLDPAFCKYACMPVWVYRNNTAWDGDGVPEQRNTPVGGAGIPPSRQRSARYASTGLGEAVLRICLDPNQRSRTSSHRHLGYEMSRVRKRAQYLGRPSHTVYR